MNAVPQVTRDYMTFGAHEGTRNTSLMHASCQLRDAGYSKDEVMQLLIPRAVADGLEQSACESTIRSVFTRDPRDPCLPAGTPPIQFSYSSGRNGKKPATVYRKTNCHPEPIPPPLDNSAIAYLETFSPGDWVSIGEGYVKKDSQGKVTLPISEGKVRSRDAWITDIKQRGMDVVFPCKEGLFARVIR